MSITGNVKTKYLNKMYVYDLQSLKHKIKSVHFS